MEIRNRSNLESTVKYKPTLSKKIYRIVSEWKTKASETRTLDNYLLNCEKQRKKTLLKKLHSQYN